MGDQYKLAGGSVIGRLHNDRGSNNQDAYAFRETEETVIAVVCDGCSSGRYSEVGARVGSTLIAETIAERLTAWTDLPWPMGYRQFWAQVSEAVLSGLGQIADVIPGDRKQVVSDYLLFTTVVAIITPEEACFASIGDGELIVNGNRVAIGDFEENAPPYIGYGLVDGTDPGWYRWKTHVYMAPGEVVSFLIGSDGVKELIEAGESEKCFPGKSRPIGPVADLWERDQYFKNPDELRRHLVLANREAKQADWDKRSIRKHPGLLSDDTTVIVGRRV